MLRRYSIILFALAALLAGCGNANAPAPGAAQGGSGDVQPVFAFSEATTGKNRIAIGLIRNNSPLNDPNAKVHLRFYDLDAANSPVKFESDATYYGKGLPAAFYVAYPTFDKPGNWGVEIQVQLAGQSEPVSSKQRLQVKPSSDVPTIGQPAISAKTLTVKDVPDLAQISSGPKPDPAMYQISLDDALKNGKPTALLFATPAFCKTATCGPSLQVMQGLQKQYGDKVNFIHVEVYKYPFDQSVLAQEQNYQKAAKENRQMTDAEAYTGIADAMVAWHLQSEPWLFLIDGKGIISGRYEGGITQEEIGPAIERLIAGQPAF